MKAFPALWCMLLGGLPWALPAATPPGGGSGVTAMQTAAGQGMDNFLGEARRLGWRAPAMPSQWHVERVTVAAQRPAEATARALGKSLALRLAELAPKMQAMPPGDELLRLTGELCDLADWCAATEGYGNVLLAARATDLAAVGVARLAADLGVPLEKIAAPAARLRLPWAGAAARRRILNAEAGAEIFPRPGQDDLSATWDSGVRLLTGTTRGGGGMAVLRANLVFFNDERPSRGELGTLVAMWDRKWHARIVDGLEPRSVRQARALVEFRRAMAAFPLRPTPTGNSGASPTTAPSRGPTLVFPERPKPPGEQAFIQAWQKYLETAPPSPADSARRAQVPGLAWAAFDAVRRGEFLDEDTRNERWHARQ